MLNQGTGPSLDRVDLTGISAHAYHGVEDFEKKDGQPFSVDVSFWLDTRQAGSIDDLCHTVNYAEVADIAYRVLTGPSLNLVETLAHRIALRILQKYPPTQRVDVCVHKPSAPIEVPFGDVAVTVSRTRDDLASAPGQYSA